MRPELTLNKLLQLYRTAQCPVEPVALPRQLGPAVGCFSMSFCSGIEHGWVIPPSEASTVGLC